MQPEPKAPFRTGGKRILLADDHPAIRNGAMQILTSALSDVEFGEAGNANEVFQRMREKSWDLLVLDMDMPGRNGLEVLKQLKDEKSTMPVLMFSLHPESQIAIRALRAGASGYLAKDSAAEELADAARQLLSGR